MMLLEAHEETGNLACQAWFERVRACTWQRFPAPANDEWLGYLDRQGEVLLPFKKR